MGTVGNWREFNLHVERVYRVSVGEGIELSQAVASVMDAFKEERLALDDGEFLQAELWDDDGNQVAELDSWGREWQVEVEE